MTAVTVQVTADDIANGVPGNCGLCPIALALHRILTDEATAMVRVVEQDIEWRSAIEGESVPALPVPVPLPRRATQFIFDFDNLNDRSHLEPFSFEIDLPGELLAAVAP